MRRLINIVVLILAVLGLIWLVKTCRANNGGSPADTVVDTVEDAGDAVGDAVRDAADEVGDAVRNID